MPRVKRCLADGPTKMPKGFYLKKGIWYKRILKPDPKTGAWTLQAESTHCKENQRQAAIDYVARRTAELEKSARLGKVSDPGRITVNELFDDLLANVAHEPTRRNYQWVLASRLRPFFGTMLASELTVAHCQAFRQHRRQQKIADTTINRDLSKVSKAFKIGIQLGKIHAMPAGGCDFHKRPERENTRRVRLPDRYYGFFRDVLHPALRCLFVVAYNIGRRLSELLNLPWDRVDFEEQCLYFESTKFGAGKAPFIGEMESWIRRQREMRDRMYPDCPYVFFWFGYRADKDGQRIARFDGLWATAVAALAERMKQDGVEPADLHFHDLRRSAHYQMRKAGVDGQTRRDIMGHESTSMDDRYTMIDDEALEDARRKMDSFQSGRGLVGATDAVKRIEELRAEIRRLEESTKQKRGRAIPRSPRNSPDIP
jgi:integrase